MPVHSIGSKVEITTDPTNLGESQSAATSTAGKVSDYFSSVGHAIITSLQSIFDLIRALFYGSKVDLEKRKEQIVLGGIELQNRQVVLESAETLLSDAEGNLKQAEEARPDILAGYNAIKVKYETYKAPSLGVVARLIGTKEPENPYLIPKQRTEKALTKNNQKIKSCIAKVVSLCLLKNQLGQDIADLKIKIDHLTFTSRPFQSHQS